MRYLNSHDFGKIIQEAISKTLNEATPPTPIGGNIPKPIGGGIPKPIGGMPKPIGGGAPQPIGQGNLNPNNPPTIQANGDDSSLKFSGKKTANGFWPGIYDYKYENFFETTDPAEQDEQVLKIFIDYIHNLTIQRWIDILNKNFGNIIYAVKVEKPWLAKKVKSPAEKDETNNFKYLVKLIIRPGKNQDFVNIADQVIDTLYKMPQVKNRMTGFSVAYDPSFEAQFVTYIKDVVNKAVSQGEIEEANIKIADTWMELLSNMKDPNVQKRIGMISGIVSSSISNNVNRGKADVRGDNGFDAGHQLSFRNKMQVFAQDPGATFVAQEFMWRAWGHEVIDPNKFIIITVPSKKKVSSDDRDKGAKMAGFGGGNDEFKLRKRRGEIEGGEVHAVKMNSQYVSSDNVQFYPVKVYDVANTRVIAGMQSKFLDGPNQERNLSNNLLGIPNAAAKSMQSTTNDDGTSQMPISTPTGPNAQLDEIKNSVVSIVKSRLQSSTPQETGNAERDIVNYAYAYAKFLLRSAFPGISKPETQEAFCQGFTAAVAIAVDIQDDAAADYLQKALASRGKDSTIKQLVVQWFNEYVDFLEDVYKDVSKKLKANAGSKKVVEEDEAIAEQPTIKPVSLDKFEELCGVDNGLYEVQEDVPTNNMLQESFFRFLDKMEHNV